MKRYTLMTTCLVLEAGLVIKQSKAVASGSKAGSQEKAVPYNFPTIYYLTRLLPVYLLCLTKNIKKIKNQLPVQLLLDL